MKTRLKYFLRTGIQAKFLRVNILLVIFVSLAIAFSIYQLSIKILGPSLEEVYPPGLLKQIYTNLNSALGVRLVGIILIVVIATFFISHRVAGPAYHIERDLGAIADGDFTKRIYLRKHDELKSIAEKLNITLDYISQNLATLKKNIETIEKSCEELKTVESEPSRRRDVSEKLALSIKEAMDAMAKFKIGE
jgi:methyl-accepting chemotaxis protein